MNEWTEYNNNVPLNGGDPVRLFLKFKYKPPQTRCHRRRQTFLPVPPLANWTKRARRLWFWHIRSIMWTWRHPQIRNFIMFSIAVRGGPSLIFFVSVPCVRLSWPSRQLLSARYSTVSYRIMYRKFDDSWTYGLRFASRQTDRRARRS